MASTTVSSDEDLQILIARAVQERKALLCIVLDGSDVSQQWSSSVSELQNRPRFIETTLVARLVAGSSQAGFLGAVCPVSSVPAAIIVQNGQVVGNFQAGSVSFENFQNSMNSRYSQNENVTETHSVDEQNIRQSSKLTQKHLELPQLTGRMRLPNNAYDRLRDLTDKALANNVKSLLILKLQLAALRSTKIPLLVSAAASLDKDSDSDDVPKLPDEIADKLLNLPASAISTPPNPQNTARSAPQATNSSSPAPNLSTSNASPPANASPGQPQSEQTSSSTSDQNTQSQPTQAQRQSYIESQKSREASAKAERERVRAQIARDKAARKEAEAAAAVTQRATNLADLRKANSTLPNPSSTDIRVQVRTFDGSTIKTTFPLSATVRTDVRPWIDQVQREKEGSTSQPYNLKVILAPLPNRPIEPGEEEQSLSDLDIRGSCTMVMIPVKGFVESYSGVSGGASGLIGSAVTGGYGLVSGAAGMLFGGVRSLLSGVGTSEPPVRQEGERSELPGDMPRSGNAGGGTGGVKVRTLADQRMEDAKKTGRDHQLYNGNQLNFEPRKDEDDSKND